MKYLKYFENNTKVIHINGVNVTLDSNEWEAFQKQNEMAASDFKKLMNKLGNVLKVLGFQYITQPIIAKTKIGELVSYNIEIYTDFNKIPYSLLEIISKEELTKLNIYSPNNEVHIYANRNSKLSNISIKISSKIEDNNSSNTVFCTDSPTKAYEMIIKHLISKFNYTINKIQPLSNSIELDMSDIKDLILEYLNKNLITKKVEIPNNFTNYIYNKIRDNKNIYNMLSNIKIKNPILYSSLSTLFENPNEIDTASDMGDMGF